MQTRVPDTHVGCAGCPSSAREGGEGLPSTRRQPATQCACQRARSRPWTPAPGGRPSRPSPERQRQLTTAASAAAGPCDHPPSASGSSGSSSSGSYSSSSQLPSAARGEGGPRQVRGAGARRQCESGHACAPTHTWQAGNQLVCVPPARWSACLPCPPPRPAPWHTHQRPWPWRRQRQLPVWIAFAAPPTAPDHPEAARPAAAPAPAAWARRTLPRRTLPPPAAQGKGQTGAMLTCLRPGMVAAPSGEEMGATGRGARALKGALSHPSSGRGAHPRSRASPHTPERRRRRRRQGPLPPLDRTAPPPRSPHRIPDADAAAAAQRTTATSLSAPV